MSRVWTAAGCLAVAGCAPRSQYHDYSTPERAARSFIEAGRVGDDASARQSVARAEQDGDLHIDYGDIGEYSLTLERLIHGQHAVVILRTGDIRSPVACVSEEGQWKVTIEGTLACMQEASPKPKEPTGYSAASAPPTPR